MMTIKKKLLLELQQGSDNWPPVPFESVWIEETEPGLFMVRNIPFYSDQVAFEDIVEVENTSQQEATLKRVVKPSGNSTIHVLLSDGLFSKEQLIEYLGKDIDCEFASERYAALSIPRSSDYSKVRVVLDRLASMQLLSFQETLLRHKIDC